jgi:hypothetical protein
MIPLPDGPYCEDVVDDKNPGPAAALIRLCNFGTGHHDLLDSHKRALQDWVIRPAYDTTHAWIDIVGHASKLGYRNSQGDNWSLSIARCQAVRDYLQQNFFRLFTPHFTAVRTGVAEGESEFHRPGVVMGVGDTQSGADPTSDHNHGFFRAVEVKLYAQGAYTWKDPAPLRRGYTTAASNRFEFEAVEYASADVSHGAASVGANCLIFGIHDLENLRRRYYWFGGGEVGPSIPVSSIEKKLPPKVQVASKLMPPISFSAEHNSSPKKLTPAVPVVDMEDFVGDGTLTGQPGFTFADIISKGGSQTLSWVPKAHKDRGVNTPLEVTFSFSRGFGLSLWSGGTGSVGLLGASFRPTVYSR